MNLSTDRHVNIRDDTSKTSANGNGVVQGVNWIINFDLARSVSYSVTSTIAPSHSFRSFKSQVTEDNTWTSKEECNNQADCTMVDWATCLKTLQLFSHEQTMKTAKQFVQADSHVRHASHALEKTSKTLDQLLEQKLTLLSTVSTLTEIQTNFGLEQLAKTYWVNPPSAE
ncbi:unnamed protein product [Absidia cylindrospora]